ncbi:MAG: hypothetical protein KDD44_15355, partial [Bdellovibrionales bacterium]|nr:hypothetical protein [Bdellovibrionales bacterium]
MSGRDVDDQARATARKAFDDAAVVFDEIVEDLRAKLKEMQGNKTDSGDTKALALREQYRGEFLMAMLLGGDVRERSADTETEAAQRNKRLDAALAKYNELVEKYGGFVPGAQAAFYVGRVQEKKGDVDAALSAYQNTLNQPEADPLRLNKTEAAALGIKLLLAKDPPQFEAAINLGRPWMDGLRPNERTLAEWQVLRLQLAKSYIGKAQGEKPGEAKKSNNSARALLVAASKVPGEHLDETRQVLASLGVEATASEDVVVEAPDSYSTALTAARELMDAAKTAALPMQVIKDQIAKGGSNVDEL